MRRLLALVLAAGLLGLFTFHAWSHPLSKESCAACATGKAAHVAADAPSLRTGEPPASRLEACAESPRLLPPEGGRTARSPPSR